jgi:RND family efflux transporter MFP subunit
MSLLKQALVCLVLVAAAAAGWYVYQRPELVGLAAADGAATAATPGRPGGAGGGNRIPGLIGGGGALNVITAPVETDAGGETVMALGTAKAARSVTIFPQVSGIVTEVAFIPGQPVEAGAVLIRLQDDEQEVAVERARVTLKQAQDTLERSETLAQSRTIAAVALAEAETAAQLAEIELKTAEIELARRTVTAPFAGTTGLTDVSVGDLVTSTTEITDLDDLSAIRVGFELPERWAGRIALDQPITAMAQALPGSQFNGRIAAIDNRIDETTRTLRLEAELANEGQALKTGMAVNVELRFDTAEQLAVPTLSVQWDRGGSYVWKVVDGAARRAAIDILQRESGIVIVQGEVAAGDKVVVEGIQRLREGAKVAEVGLEPAAVDEGAPPAAEEPSVSAGQPARARS